MLHIDPAFYGPVCARLLPRDTQCPLGPGVANESMRPELERLNMADLVGSYPLDDPDMAHCCLAALWLRHGFLDESHAISQSLASPSGSYWHGIMHRREPDYSNAKYWFRRVGVHPIFERLWEASRQLVASQPPDHTTKLLAQQSQWAPYLFVDLCDEVAGSGQPGEVLCRQIADLEWQLLFDYCYRQATGQTQ